MKKLTVLIFLFSISIKGNAQLYTIEKDGKYGAINNKFTIVIKPSYDEIRGFRKGYTVAKLHQKYGVLNTKGERVIPFQYEDLYHTNLPKVFVFEKDQKYGLITVSGKEILPPNYGFSIAIVNKGKNYIVTNAEDKYALLDKKGIQLTNFKYDYIEGDLPTSIYSFRIGEKYGYINTKGEEIIPAKFQYAARFQGNYAIVKNNGKSGIIDKKGATVLPFVYDNILYKHSFEFDQYNYDNAEVFYLSKNGKYGILDKKLKTIVAIEYDVISNFNEGYAYVKKEGKYGFINKKGELVIPLEYDDAYPFTEGVAGVLKNGKWGYIDSQNNVKIDFKLMGCVTPFSEGLAMYRKRNFNSGKGYYTSDKCGYINKGGEEQIPTIYRTGEQFSEGVAVVTDYNHNYLIDKNGNTFKLKEADQEVIEVEEIMEE